MFNKKTSRMKKILFLMMVVAAMAACSDGEDGEGNYVNTNPISMYVDDGVVLDMNYEPQSVVSENDFIVSVYGDSISGFHVGNTNVVIDEKHVIPVEVKGRYNTWIDPVTEWGCSKEYVKSHYKECTLEVDDEEDDVLIYSDSGSSELVGYSFKDGGLAFVVVYIKTFYSSEVVNFLTERFFMVPYPEEPLIAAGFNHYDTDKADTYVGLAMENISYLTIGYMVYDKSAESKSSASLECELKNKIDELNQIINK